MIVEAEPGLLVVAPGETVTLMCRVDDHYEWCKWHHPGGEFCDFEWKRKQDNITMQECEQLRNRLTFFGDYEKQQCGITFKATESDTGIWRCEIEEYKLFGTRGSGRVKEATMNITVQIPTTTLAPITTTSTTSTTTTTLTGSTTTETTTKKATREEDETPTAVPRVDDGSQQASHSSIALIVVVLIIIVIVVAVSGTIYYRKRKNSASATAVYEREEKSNGDQRNMVERNSDPNITFHQNGRENSNLHEFYPPNLTYSTVTPESEA